MLKGHQHSYVDAPLLLKQNDDHVFLYLSKMYCLCALIIQALLHYFFLQILELTQASLMFQLQEAMLH